MEHQVWIRFQGKYHKFFKTFFQLNDASVMVVVNGNSAKTVRINYHATGHVNYHGLNSRAVFQAPLGLLNHLVRLLFYSIPSISDLTETADTLTGTEKESIVEVPDDHEGRLSFVFSIAPVGFPALPNHLAVFEIGNAFSIQVTRSEFETINPISSDEFLFMNAKDGPFKNQTINQGDAIHASLQRFNQKKGSMLILPPNGAGVMKIVPSVPMRIVPKVQISFAIEGFTARVIEEQSTTYRIAIEIRGNNNSRVTTMPPITGVSLDAEMY